MTTQTAAEQLAEAEARAAAATAELQAATEASKAARLPSALAAQTYLNSTAVTNVLNNAKAMVEDCLDDQVRSLGTPGNEGARQSVNRLAVAIEDARARVARRVTELQPPTDPAT